MAKEQKVNPATDDDPTSNGGGAAKLAFWKAKLAFWQAIIVALITAAGSAITTFLATRDREPGAESGTVWEDLAPSPADTTAPPEIAFHYREIVSDAAVCSRSAEDALKIIGATFDECR